MRRRTVAAQMDEDLRFPANDGHRDGVALGLALLGGRRGDRKRDGQRQILVDEQLPGRRRRVNTGNNGINNAYLEERGILCSVSRCRLRAALPSMTMTTM